MARGRIVRRMQTRVRFRPDQAHSLIQTGNVATRLRAAYDVKGKAVVPQLGDVMHPVTVVDDLSKPNWYSTPLVERAAAVKILQGAIAGEFATISINASPGILVRVNFVGVSNAGALALNYGFGVVAPGAASLGFFKDRRLAPVGGNASAQVFTGTNGADVIPSKIGELRTTATMAYVVSPDIGAVLQPQQAGQNLELFLMEAQTANVAVTYFMDWIEYDVGL